MTCTWRGSRLNTYLLNSKRTQQVQASREVKGACFPRKCFGFYLPKVPFPGFLSHSDRILEVNLINWNHSYLGQVVLENVSDA